MAKAKDPRPQPGQDKPQHENRPQHEGQPAGNATAAERLERLIESKLRAAPRRGALEVALALAAVTDKVRVNAAAEPFVTTPADLLERAFDDAEVAIDAEGMAVFKANLVSLLPGIAGAITAIPGDPRLRIGDVAKLVALSLPLQPSTARREGRPPQTPSIVTARPVHDAREQARNRYGTHFAIKASDAVLMTMRRDAGVSFGIMRSPMRESTVRGQTPDTLVLELNVPDVQGRESSTSLHASGPSIRAAARSVEREATDRRVGSSGLLRQAHVANIRDRFFKAIAPLYSEIGSRVSAPGGAGALSTRRTLDVCWLNQTLRTIAAPEALAEAAADDTIERIDLPRRLVREVRLCVPLVGAPDFRTRTGRDGAGIVVAVIDGEVDARHPALAGRVMQKRNMTREPFGLPDEHGTAVAGIIGSADARFRGVAPGVSILSYKVFTTRVSLDADDFDAGQAIQQALEDGAHVANCSWGVSPVGRAISREARACDRAWDLGMVIVKSAGNKGPGARTLTTPADAEGIIVVGATDRGGGSVQPYSSRGPAGTRDRPHLVAPGGTRTSGVESCLPGGTFGSAGSGTSFAAPHISGLAALLLADDPNLLPDAVRDALVLSCRPLAAGDGNTQGAGLIRMS